MIRLLLIFCLFSLSATMPVSGVAAIESEKPETSHLITKFPFHQLTGGIIIVKAVINHIPDSLNFILDTGSGAISLDSSTAGELQIPNFPSGVKVSGIAGIREVNYSIDNVLHFPGLSVDSLNFYISDYSLLTSVYGLRIDGIIGYSFLSRYIVSIDYDQRVISVFSQGDFAYDKGSYLLKPLFTKLPIQPIRIRDARSLKGNFYFDIGAGLSFLVTTTFEQDSSFFKKKRRPAKIFVQGAGGKTELLLTIMKKLKIGPYTFRRIPTNILDDENNALGYPRVGGLIGNDLMRRFNVVLNYATRTIAIKPNTHFRDQFDYSYTGMNLYMDEMGRIVIDDIVNRSPADKAGLRNGDIVIGIGGNFSGQLVRYHEILRRPGEKISMIISRDDNLRQMDLKVGKIK